MFWGVVTQPSATSSPQEVQLTVSMLKKPDTGLGDTPLTGFYWALLRSSGGWLQSPYIPPPHRQGLPLQGLQDEVAHHPAVIHVHPGAKRVEDSGHPHLHSFLRWREITSLTPMGLQQSLYPGTLIWLTLCDKTQSSCTLFLPLSLWSHNYRQYLLTSPPSLPAFILIYSVEHKGGSTNPQTANQLHRQQLPHVITTASVTFMAYDTSTNHIKLAYDHHRRPQPIFLRVRMSQLNRSLTDDYC